MVSEIFLEFLLASRGLVHGGGNGLPRGRGPRAPSVPLAPPRPLPAPAPAPAPLPPPGTILPLPLSLPLPPSITIAITITITITTSSVPPRCLVPSSPPFRVLPTPLTLTPQPFPPAVSLPGARFFRRLPSSPPCPPSLARLGPLVKTLLLYSWTACRALSSLSNFRRQTGGVPSSHSASFGLLAFPSPGRGASSGLRRHHGRPPSPSPSFLGPYHPAGASSPRSQWLPPSSRLLDAGLFGVFWLPKKKERYFVRDVLFSVY